MNRAIRRTSFARLTLWAGFLAALGCVGGVLRADEADPYAELASRVVIVRDEYGVPHVTGEDDAATLFGFGYAQAEDFFWQVEDAYILALGRYSEVYGPKGLNSDLLNRAFDVVPRSRRDFAALDATTRNLCAAFAGGINYYLQRHPETKPRLVQRFEPWHVLAHHRHTAVELCFRFTGLSDDVLPRRNPVINAATGSNGWAINGPRTDHGQAMLLAAPHMPWFGFTQLAEAHLTSRGQAPGEQPWNFTGAGFYGSPALALGHNDRLGWTLVTNRPSIASAWRERFAKPDEPLAYAYGEGWLKADERTETIRVKKSYECEERAFTFLTTRHGPVVKQEADGTKIAVQISGLYEAAPMRQWLAMVRAKNLDEFRAAVDERQILYMNVLYADGEGNIWFLYNGSVPRRDPQFDWSQPVDGSDPATEWHGVHDLAELPQTLNPACHYLQNCNSSPLLVAENISAKRTDFPSYMIGDADVRTRRARRSIAILQGLDRTDFASWSKLAFDDVVLWAVEERAQLRQDFAKLEAADPQAARAAKPYVDHLLTWDGRIAAESTAATLCEAWYELLYGGGYPGETIRTQFRDSAGERLAALVSAAEGLASLHGSWKVPYGELFRLQRVAGVADLSDARFDDEALSLPCLGGHGPMGATFTTYFSPSVVVPLVVSQRRRYGLVGASYTAAWEFSPSGVRGASLVPFGASGDPKSPHYFDQAKLFSERRMKPEHFTAEEVSRHAVRTYHPGE
jgi:penicillin amidase